MADVTYPAPKGRAELTLDGTCFTWGCTRGWVEVDAPRGASLRRDSLHALAAFDRTVDKDGYVITQGSGAAASDPVASNTGEPSAAAPSSVPAPAPREWWVNFYRYGHSVHASREAADSNHAARFQCVHVREIR